MVILTFLNKSPPLPWSRLDPGAKSFKQFEDGDHDYNDNHDNDDIEDDDDDKVFTMDLVRLVW